MDALQHSEIPTVRSLQFTWKLAVVLAGQCVLVRPVFPVPVAADVATKMGAFQLPEGLGALQLALEEGLAMHFCSCAEERQSEASSCSSEQKMEHWYEAVLCPRRLQVCTHKLLGTRVGTMSQAMRSCLLDSHLGGGRLMGAGGGIVAGALGCDCSTAAGGSGRPSAPATGGCLTAAAPCGECTSDLGGADPISPLQPGSQQEADTDTHLLGQLRSWRRPISDRIEHHLDLAEAGVPAKAYIDEQSHCRRCLPQHLDIQGNRTSRGKGHRHTGTRASATKRLMKASAVPLAVCNGVVAAGGGADG